MTREELIARVRTRGGQLRVTGARLRYRPPGVLTPDELAWLVAHQVEVAQALSPPSNRPGSGPTGQPFGEAGPGVAAWHCRIDLGSGHARATRADGSSYCATCHPTTLAGRGRA